MNLVQPILHSGGDKNKLEKSIVAFAVSKDLVQVEQHRETPVSDNCRYEVCVQSVDTVDSVSVRPSTLSVSSVATGFVDRCDLHVDQTCSRKKSPHHHVVLLFLKLFRPWSSRFFSSQFPWTWVSHCVAAVNNSFEKKSKAI